MLIRTLKYFFLGICRVEQHFKMESFISRYKFLHVSEKSVNKILCDYILFLLKFLTSQELLIS